MSGNAPWKMLESENYAIESSRRDTSTNSANENDTSMRCTCSSASVSKLHNIKAMPTLPNFTSLLLSLRRVPHQCIGQMAF